ncbi:hypothetical protein OHA79_30905 [Streptomyces sp. NBC_00841]|uniref:hypothetical protein n=1 Tax=unclassified Streptomyces TaxID=2593676 RepID=UPI00225B1CA5|nr:MULTISPECIES: hypothetical protein [unclassified Streptomyces]MCX4532656.1 hypothetical protein [Streptomyces sp. NBC_01669]WSA01869.1 hypothetical protein OHA79_30905 [Streptomyces sp. NBC_00841]
MLFRVRAGSGKDTPVPQTGMLRSVGRTAAPLDSMARPVGEVADERQLARRRANPDGTGLKDTAEPVTGSR